MTGHALKTTVVIAALALTACTAPRASTAAPASTLPTTGVATSASTANTAVAHFLDVAHAAFPDEGTTRLVAEARTICATLREDPSVHDTVGNLSSRTRNQAIANEVVRAAIAAYCPDIPAR